MIKKILNNATIMSWASYFVTFGSMLFVFPLIITVYTEIEQSFWWLLATIVSLALKADSGFGSVLVRGVAYFKAGSDSIPRSKKEFDQHKALEKDAPINMDKLLLLLSTTNTIYLILSGILIVILSTIGPFVLRNIMELADNRIDFWAAYILLIPNCIVQILAVRWRSFMRGLNFIAMEARFNTIMGVIRIIAFTIMLTFGLSPFYLVLFMFFDTCLKFFYLRWFVRKWFFKQGRKITNPWKFDKNIFKSLWAASYKMGVIDWGIYFVEYGNNLLIAQISNPTLMASFLLTTRILSFISSFSRITLYSNIPTIYSLAAKKKMKEMKFIASGYMFIGISMMTVATLFAAYLGNPILGVVSDHAKLVPFGLFLIMALSQLLDMHASFHAGIYTSTNHIPFMWPSILSGLAVVGFGRLILPYYGLIGIIMVRFLVQLTFNNWYAVFLSLRLLKWPFFKYIYELPIFGTKFILERGKSFIKK